MPSPATTRPAPLVYLETFGCQMNELDSELVTGALRTLGYKFTADLARASVVLYNTCSVREHAEQKVWSRLGELALRKAREPGLVVGVMGCMAEREGEQLLKRMPVVDVLVGPGELDKLPALVDNAIRTRLALLDDPDTIKLAATPELEKPDTGLLRSAGQVALQGTTNRRSATLAAAQDTLELLDLARSIASGEPGETAALTSTDASTDANTDDIASPAPSGRRSAYVRITRGCNKFCTYCVVPFTRGAEVHRPPEHIIDECKRLADAGVIEITLLGQTVNHYRFEHGASVTIGGITQPQKGRAYRLGVDVDGDPYRGQNVTTFADLLRQIHERVPAIQRLRFVTSFPLSFGNDILQVMRDSPRICRYLHIPGQSGSDRILKLMNRQYTVAEYFEFLDRARSFLHQPEIGRPLTLAGDIIVGFPTETEEDFQATRDLLIKARYKNCYIFKYSPRPGTIAIDKYPDDVPDLVKRKRNNELLALQNQISESVGAEFVGQTLPVFITGISKRQTRAERRSSSGGSHQEPSHHPSSAGIALTISGRPLNAQANSHDASDEPDHGCSTTGSTIVSDDPAPTQITSTRPSSIPAGPIQLACRTEGDVIAFLDCPSGQSPDDLIGSIRRLRIIGSEPLALHGQLVD